MTSFQMAVLGKVVALDSLSGTVMVNLNFNLKD
jgi:hypothetical protein